MVPLAEVLVVRVEHGTRETGAGDDLIVVIQPGWGGEGGGGGCEGVRGEGVRGEGVYVKERVCVCLCNCVRVLVCGVFKAIASYYSH